jgi:plastocyanin
LWLPLNGFVNTLDELVPVTAAKHARYDPDVFRKVAVLLGATLLAAVAAACGPSGPVLKVSANNTQSLDSYRFSPDDFSIPQGGSIQLFNLGDVEHNLTVDGQNVSIDVGVGQSNQAEIDLPPGTYTFQCTIVEGATTHGQLGMKGRFTVTPKP